MSSLALPYLLQVEGDLQRDNTFRLDFKNRGGAGAMFHVASGDYTDLPRSYTIGPGRHLSDAWSAPLDYDLSVFGPNAFFRQFQGDTIGRYRTDLAIRTSLDDDRLTIVIASASPHAAPVRIRSASSLQEQAFVLNRGDVETRTWSLRSTDGWYDLTVTLDDNPKFRRQLAGTSAPNSCNDECRLTTDRSALLTARVR